MYSTIEELLDKEGVCDECYECAHARPDMGVGWWSCDALADADCPRLQRLARETPALLRNQAI